MWGRCLIAQHRRRIVNLNYLFKSTEKLNFLMSTLRATLTTKGLLTVSTRLKSPNRVRNLSRCEQTREARTESLTLPSIWFFVIFSNPNNIRVNIKISNSPKFQKRETPNYVESTELENGGFFPQILKNVPELQENNYGEHVAVESLHL